MIRRTLLTSALVVLGATAIAPKAMAQNISVPFTGNVRTVCSFSSLVAGGLAGNSGSNSVALGSNYSGGREGKFNVTCNAPSNLNVSAPVQISGPERITARSWNSQVFDSRNQYALLTNTGTRRTLAINPGANQPMRVRMYVNKGTTIRPGTYSYRVTATVTPR